MKAKYCKCQNTYTIKDCDEDRRCNAPHYWRQGIGSITGTAINALIQEDGGLILQENNGKIII